MAARLVIGNSGRVLKKRVSGFNFKKPSSASLDFVYHYCLSLLLQHQQRKTPYYTESEKSSSELVQLLKPKSENMNCRADQDTRQILPVGKSSSSATLQNHSTSSAYSNPPASGIPPPLATDFAQANTSSG